MTTTCPSMPNQIDVVMDDGTRFYFRARHGYWALYRYTRYGGPKDWDIDWDNPIADGEEPDAGWWEVVVAEAFCREVIERLEAQ